MINRISIRVYEDTTDVEVPASDIALVCLAQYMADVDGHARAIVYTAADEYVIVKHVLKDKVPGSVSRIMYPTQ
jgi:hypothetical protein